MQGLHLHVGSQILQTEPFAAAVASVARLGEFPVYDLGGGLGARYTWSDEPPTVAAYLDTLAEAARAHLPADAVPFAVAKLTDTAPLDPPVRVTVTVSVPPFSFWL